MGLPAMAFVTYSYNTTASFDALINEIYGEYYYIAIHHSDAYATVQANFQARDLATPSHQIHIPYYIIENAKIDPIAIRDYLDPYLIKLTIPQCCDIMREAIKLAKKG